MIPPLKPQERDAFQNPLCPRCGVAIKAGESVIRDGDLMSHVPCVLRAINEPAA